MFTKALSYQFGLFFPEFAEIPRALVNAVPSALQGTADTKYLLRGLKDPAIENALVATGMGPLMQTQNLVWTAGAGVWRVVLSKMRVDIFFDAQTYRDVKELDEPPSIDDIVKYISPRLTAFVKSSNLQITRLALVVVGQTAPDSRIGASSAALLRRFPMPNIEPDELTDGAVRLNHASDWVLVPRSSPVRINKIETVNANWVLTDSGPQTSLAWQADANILPSTQEPDYASIDGAIAGFFSKASQWASDQKKTMEATYATTQ